MPTYQVLHHLGQLLVAEVGGPEKMWEGDECEEVRRMELTQGLHAVGCMHGPHACDAKFRICMTGV